MNLHDIKSDPVPESPPVACTARASIWVWLIALLLALAIVAIFWPATRCEFISFDDHIYVTADPQVQQGLTWHGIKWAFLNDANANWHPLTMMSHMLDCQMYGLEPWGHHLTSVLFHAANTALVFLLLQYLTDMYWRSLLVAAFFGLHPLHVESVAWVSERKDVLSTFFGLLSLIFYARYAKAVSRKWKTESGNKETESYGFFPSSILHPLCSPAYYLSLGCLALGLMSKSMLVTWPFVILLLDYWPLNRMRIAESPAPMPGQAGMRNFKMLFLEKIPFFVLAAIVSVLTFIAQKQGGAMMSMGHFPIGERCMNALVSYSRYLGRMFWPENLAIFYPYSGQWGHWVVIGAGILLICITAIAWVKRREWPFMLMGWLWFCGTLVPVIGLVQVGGQSIADRYMYIPSLGILILVIWGVYELTRQRRYLAMAVSGVLVVALLVCCAATRRQLGYWRNSGTLMRHALDVTKDNYIAHANLGFALFEKGRLDDAIAEFQEAIRLNPDFAEAYFNYGNVLVRKDDLDGAIRLFETAIGLYPDYTVAYDSLGDALEKKGDLDGAIRVFQEAVKRGPGLAGPYNNLGNVLDKKGETDEAMRMFQAAILIDPDFAEAHCNLGTVLDKKNRLDEAIGEYQTAIRLDPKYATAHYNLGIDLYRAGRIDDAITQFQDATRFKPDYAEAWNNLGNVLVIKGQLDQAISQYRQAIRLKPDYADAHYNLATTYLTKGLLDEAIRQFQEDIRLNPNDTDARDKLAHAIQLKNAPAKQ